MFLSLLGNKAKSPGKVIVSNACFTSEKELNETEDTQSKVEISESNEELEDKSQLRDEPKNKKKSLEPVLKPNNKKSSPFNVVMTPSDKKKYHTFKNQTSYTNRNLQLPL